MLDVVRILSQPSPATSKEAVPLPDIALLRRRLRRVWLIFWDSEIVCKRHYFSNFAFNTKKHTLVNTNISTIVNTKKST